MSMRVYEFSKKYGVPTKDLLGFLSKQGFEVGSHMSILSDKHLACLQGFVGASISSVKKGGESVSKGAVPKKKHQGQKDIKDRNTSDKKAKGSVKKNSVFVAQSMTVNDFAQQANRSVVDVILILMRWGVIAAKNQLLEKDIVVRLAQHYAIEYVLPHQGSKSGDCDEISGVAHEDQLESRAPVVVIVGHVDHGKTTLLDFIRKTRVASREKGGITQHLGAYQAVTPQGRLVFIDTPGHEAFSRMRLRGARVADIVVLVVAADDGIMPQTVEAIKHAKSMGVPIVVAVNKIDKVDISRVDVIKRQLAQHDLLTEDWGGDIVVVPISAQSGQNVDQLLEMIVLQTQLMELQGEVESHARGFILESLLEKGRGPVATILLRHGTISVGDFFVCGQTCGKVNSIVDSFGSSLQSVGPSNPVRIAGFSALPEPGEFFKGVSAQEYKSARSSLGKQEVSRPVASGAENSIKIIVKTDSNSSREALLDSIESLSSREKHAFVVVHASVGNINESDILLADSTGALIFGLHVKLDTNAMLLAREKSVSVNIFGIIYKLIESLEERALQNKVVAMKKVKTGEAVVRRVFKIKDLGVIAGCYVKDGTFVKDGFVVVKREGYKIGEGAIKSLQREKRVVKEVHAGYECAFLIDNFEDWSEEDIVECFNMVPDAQ